MSTTAGGDGAFWDGGGGAGGEGAVVTGGGGRTMGGVPTVPTGVVALPELAPDVVTGSVARVLIGGGGPMTVRANTDAACGATAASGGGRAGLGGVAALTAVAAECPSLAAGLRPRRLGVTFLLVLLLSLPVATGVSTDTAGVVIDAEASTPPAPTPHFPLEETEAVPPETLDLGGVIIPPVSAATAAAATLTVTGVLVLPCTGVLPSTGVRSSIGVLLRVDPPRSLPDICNAAHSDASAQAGDMDVALPTCRRLRHLVLECTSPSSSFPAGDPLLQAEPVAELAGLTLRLAASFVGPLRGAGTHGGGGFSAAFPAAASAAPKPSVLHAALASLSNIKGFTQVGA